jgi:hypothetical protein
MNKPRYFIAVFGKPRPGKEKVDSGIYGPNPNYSFDAKPGDIMLLYCTGVVLAADSARIEYRWIPFTRPILKSTIDGNLDTAAAAKFKNIRFVANWLIEMSEVSFSKIVGDRTTAWGKL